MNWALICVWAVKLISLLMRVSRCSPLLFAGSGKKATIVVGDSVRPLILHEKRWWMQNRRMLVTVFHCHPWRVSLF